MNRALHERLAAAFKTSRPKLWGVCYRMTGNISDADELVQDTFARALEREPADLERSLEPWLMRVAINLATDRLRRRKAQPYSGQWLPDPVLLNEGADAEQRLIQKQALSMECMVALEALTPTCRAVFLLRELYDYSTAECAQALAITPSNVKTSLHRARQLLDSPQLQWRARHALPSHAHDGALWRLFLAIQSQDLALLESLLSQDIHLISDGAGEVAATLNVIHSPSHVARFLSVSQRRGAALEALRFVRTHHGSGLYTRIGSGLAARAPREHLWWVVPNAAGQVCAIYVIVAPSKLKRLLSGL